MKVLKKYLHPILNRLFAIVEICCLAPSVQPEGSLPMGSFPHTAELSAVRRRLTLPAFAASMN